MVNYVSFSSVLASRLLSEEPHNITEDVIESWLGTNLRFNTNANVELALCVTFKIIIENTDPLLVSRALVFSMKILTAIKSEKLLKEAVIIPYHDIAHQALHHPSENARILFTLFVKYHFNEGFHAYVVSKFYSRKADEVSWAIGVLTSIPGIPETKLLVMHAFDMLARTKRHHYIEFLIEVVNKNHGFIDESFPQNVIKLVNNDMFRDDGLEIISKVKINNYNRYWVALIKKLFAMNTQESLTALLSFLQNNDSLIKGRALRDEMVNNLFSIVNDSPIAIKCLLEMTKKPEELERCINRYPDAIEFWFECMKLLYGNARWLQGFLLDFTLSHLVNHFSALQILGVARWDSHNHLDRIPTFLNWMDRSTEHACKALEKFLGENCDGLLSSQTICAIYEKCLGYITSEHVHVLLMKMVQKFGFDDMSNYSDLIWVALQVQPNGHSRTMLMVHICDSCTIDVNWEHFLSEFHKCMLEWCTLTDMEAAANFLPPIIWYDAIQGLIIANKADLLFELTQSKNETCRAKLQACYQYILDFFKISLINEEISVWHLWKSAGDVVTTNRLNWLWRATLSCKKLNLSELIPIFDELLQRHGENIIPDINLLDAFLKRCYKLLRKCPAFIKIMIEFYNFASMKLHPEFLDYLTCQFFNPKRRMCALETILLTLRYLIGFPYKKEITHLIALALVDENLCTRKISITIAEYLDPTPELFRLVYNARISCGMSVKITRT